jgi:hypothetical protein
VFVCYTCNEDLHADRIHLSSLYVVHAIIFIYLLAARTDRHILTILYAVCMLKRVIIKKQGAVQCSGANTTWTYNVV